MLECDFIVENTVLNLLNTKFVTIKKEVANEMKIGKSIPKRF